MRIHGIFSLSTITLASALLLGATACSKQEAAAGGEGETGSTSQAAEAPKMELTVGHEKLSGKKTFTPKKAVTYASTFTLTAGGEMKKGATFTIYASDADFGKGLEMRKPPEGDAVKVSIQLVGKEGTSGKETDMAPEPGTYKAEEQYFMKVRSLQIMSGGERHSVRDVKGTVKAEAAEGGKVKLTADLTGSGGAEVKGTFEASLGPGK